MLDEQRWFEEVLRLSGHEVELGLHGSSGGSSTIAGGSIVTGRIINTMFDSFILDGANFAHATLDGADFTSASLRPNGGIGVNFAGARLTNAYFTQAVLEQAGFSGAVLGGVQKDEAAHFSFAFDSPGSAMS